MALSILLGSGLGCHSIRNAWLDPTALGAFDRTSTLEIRSSLTLEDTPPGIPGAVYPTPEDLELIVEEYTLSAGDTLAVEIFELRERQMPYQVQVQITSTGFVNLPILGRIEATGLTIPELEVSLETALRDQNILLEPDVTVTPLFLQHATYSIFGVGVSAATNAPLRAGTFPIRRPDLRVLEAVNQVGGLNEFVTEVYIFRTYEPPAKHVPSANNNRREPQHPSPGSGNGTTPDAGAPRSPEDELFDAVLGEDAAADPRNAAAEPPTAFQELEPDPTQPYLWINDEFVPNPAYQRPASETEAPAPAPAWEMAAPAVNWARLAGDTTFRVLVLPAESLRNGDPQSNIYVRPGDIIRIVSGEIGVYYVMGQVNRVGSFAFNSEQITLKAAIAAAGGLASLAWPDRCTVYRRVGSREQMIQVDLDRIFAGKEPDFIIRRGDIINVGTHPFAPFLQRIRGLTLPNPVSNLGYSFTYSRNFADIDSFSVRQNPRNQPDRFPNLFP